MTEYAIGFIVGIFATLAACVAALLWIVIAEGNARKWGP